MTTAIKFQLPREILMLSWSISVFQIYACVQAFCHPIRSNYFPVNEIPNNDPLSLNFNLHITCLPVESAHSASPTDRLVSSPSFHSSVWKCPFWYLLYSIWDMEIINYKPNRLCPKIEQTNLKICLILCIIK